jgi:hypothetical protein
MACIPCPYRQRNSVHRGAAASILALLAGWITTGTPLACRAQLHSTGFSYGITLNGISQSQRLRTIGANTSSLQTTVNNLDLTNPNVYRRLNPGIPDFDYLQQQTLNNQRTTSVNNATILSNQFSFSVFRSNQFQPAN